MSNRPPTSVQWLLHIIRITIRISELKGWLVVKLFNGLINSFPVFVTALLAWLFFIAILATQVLGCESIGRMRAIISVCKGAACDVKVPRLAENWLETWLAVDFKSPCPIINYYLSLS